MTTPVELVTSYAYRDGEAIRLVMDLPTLAPAGAEVSVRLRRGNRFLYAEGTASAATTGTRIEATVPGRRLGRRAWTLAIQPAGENEYQPIQARLLARFSQPVALLTGPVPTTRMAEPQPRAVPKPAPSLGARARSVAGRIRRRIKRG